MFAIYDPEEQEFLDCRAETQDEALEKAKSSGREIMADNLTLSQVRFEIHEMRRIATVVARNETTISVEEEEE